jgi:hypothetical protein
MSVGSAVLSGTAIGTITAGEMIAAAAMGGATDNKTVCSCNVFSLSYQLHERVHSEHTWAIRYFATFMRSFTNCRAELNS